MFKHILIPTDGSELSDKAVSAGIDLAARFRARITGLHVFPTRFAAYYGELVWVDDKLEMQMRETAETAGTKFLDRLQTAARTAGLEFQSVLLEGDSPWQGIIDTAQRRGCDLIVMAAHGRRGLTALVLGSETNKVLTHSKIPVLVYR